MRTRAAGIGTGSPARSPRLPAAGRRDGDGAQDDDNADVVGGGDAGLRGDHRRRLPRGHAGDEISSKDEVVKTNPDHFEP